MGEISSRPDLKNDLVESVQDPACITPGFPKTLFGGYEDSQNLDESAVFRGRLLRNLWRMT